MKRNLIFVTFLLSILVVAFVSAGITGKVVSLKEQSSESVSLDGSNYDIAVQSVTDGTVTVQVTNQQTGQAESVAISEGENAVTSTGVEVKIEDVRRPFFGIFRPRADVRVTPAPKVTPTPEFIPADAALQPDFPTPKTPTLPKVTTNNSCELCGCNGDLTNLDGATSFRYWEKRDNANYHDSLIVKSDSGEVYTLSFNLRFDSGDNRNETDVRNVCTGVAIVSGKVAGDVVDIGDASFTIDNVFVNDTDEHVDLKANFGTSFFASCVDDLRDDKVSNDKGVLLNFNEADFIFWNKRNSLNHAEYITLLPSGTKLKFIPRFDSGDNRNETSVLNVVTGKIIAEGKVAGDVINVGNDQLTIKEVYINDADEYVRLEA